MTAPRLSLLLLVYNQAGTVEQAVNSCLAQQGETIEVVLSDDASTDDSYLRLQHLAAKYHGPHRVLLNRNPHNLGIGAHLNRLVEISHGELLVVAAGDDESLPLRCQRLADAWEAAGRRPDLLASPLNDLGADGSLHGVVSVDDLGPWTLDRWLCERPHVIGAAQAWTRRAFERFGPLHPHIAYEDQIMTFRAMAGGGALTLPDALVNYRRGGTSAKARPLTAQGVRERMQVQNQRHLAEVEQLRRDAEVAGLATRVHPALQGEWDRQRCLRDLLAAPGWSAAFAQAAHYPALPRPWRLRKLLAVQLAAWSAWTNRRRAG
jgi:GT2 family glycosyltransferase